MAAKDELGRRGEELAAAHLRGAGFEVLERNWRCREGELDIVARDGEHLVVVEVKTRSGVGWGHPFEAITPVKLARLRVLATQWRRAHPHESGQLRVDAIAVILPRAGAVTVEHLAGIG